MNWSAVLPMVILVGLAVVGALAACISEAGQTKQEACRRRVPLASMATTMTVGIIAIAY